MQNEIIPHKEEALHTSGRVGMGFSIKQTDRSLTLHCFTAYSTDTGGRTLQLGKEGGETQAWTLKEQTKPTLCFCLGQDAPFPGGLSAVSEHAGHHEGI